MVKETQCLALVLADFARCDLKREERNICKLRSREVVIRVEIQALYGSDCCCMHELKEK